METIEVKYSPIGDGSYFHKYIVYTDSYGNEYAARGGPTNGPSGGSFSGLTTAETPGFGTWWSPFGPIDTTFGEYGPDFIDYDPSNTNPSETIKTGDDLSGDWGKIIDAIEKIDTEQHPYQPASQNSNTTVDEALRRAELPLPQNDDYGENWAPGSHDLGDTLDPKNIWDKIEDAVRDFYDTAKDYIFRKDPLTFDLDGDGIETVGISATNPILFDHDGDGIKNGTGWVQPDDALLVLDRNGNGQVDNGLELFGDNTVLTSGARAGQKAADGFDALADLDTNLDGLVSGADSQFASLRLWRDLNQDGISQSGELFSLSSQGIVSINVASTAQSVTLRNGNELADMGSFTRVDGSAGALGSVTGKLGDVNLSADTFHRHFPDTLNTASVKHLPNMQGSGAVNDKDWRVAA